MCAQFSFYKEYAILTEYNEQFVEEISFDYLPLSALLLLINGIF